MTNESIQGDISILSLVEKVDKLVDQNQVNERLKDKKWILIGVGNMMQVTKFEEGSKTRIAIGQTPYYILGRLRV